jgi:hypothetical protein
MKEQGIIPHLVAELNTNPLSRWERDGVRGPFGFPSPPPVSSPNRVPDISALACAKQFNP